MLYSRIHQEARRATRKCLSRNLLSTITMSLVTLKMIHISTWWSPTHGTFQAVAIQLTCPLQDPKRKYQLSTLEMHTEMTITETYSAMTLRHHSQNQREELTKDNGPPQQMLILKTLITWSNKMHRPLVRVHQHSTIILMLTRINLDPRDNQVPVTKE